MHLSTSMRGLALGALLSAGLTAQTLLPVPAGTPSLGGGDDVAATVTMPFMFPFPGGTMTDTVDMTTNGRIFPAGLDAPDFTESVGEFLAIPQICAYWDDLTDDDGAGDQLFYHTTIAGIAVFTWVDVRELFVSGPFTMQVQLTASGDITIVWDSRLGGSAGVDGDAIVGVSSGAAGDVVDFTDVATAGVIVSSNATVFETFGLGGYDLNDGASDSGLAFTTAGPTSYVVTGMVPLLANAGGGRRACSDNVGFTLLPTFPGYVVTPGATFDAAFRDGSIAVTGDDSLADNVAISFPFRFPGRGPAAAVNEILITSNGRLHEPAATTFADSSPSVSEFETDTWAAIAPLWTDLDPSDPVARGNVWFHDDGTGTSASVTWDGIPDFGGGPNDLNTFQVRIFSNDRIEFVYFELNGIDRDVLIGVGPGATVDADGEADLTTPGGVVSTDDIVYEFWDDPAETVDLPLSPPNATARLVPVTGPRIGGPAFEVDVIDETASATLAVYFLGFPTGLFTPTPVPFPFTPSCEILVDLFAGVPFTSVTGTPGMPTVVADFTAAPAVLIGFDFFRVQAVVVNPTLTPALFVTDELNLLLGT